jgi:hypothetical protein
MRRSDILQSLETHKDELVEIGVKSLVIFRSAAGMRPDQTATLIYWKIFR